MRLTAQWAAIAALAGLLEKVQALTDDLINSQVRIAYATDRGMTVSWNTFDKLSRPVVHYGRSPEHLCKRASSNVSVTYPTSLTYNNHVTIRGLKPDTTYYYLPSHLLHDNSTTAPYSFRTSRAAGDGTPHAVAVIIDIGTMGPKGLTTSAGQTVNPNNILKPGENNTMQSLEKLLHTYDFMLHRKFITHAYSSQDMQY